MLGSVFHWIPVPTFVKVAIGVRIPSFRPVFVMGTFHALLVFWWEFEIFKEGRVVLDSINDLRFCILPAL